MKKIFVLFFILSGCMSDTIAQNNLVTRAVATNLDTPWEILWGPDDYIWFTERPGRVSRVNPETSEVFEIIDIGDVRENGEGGLLGMVLDPDFQENNYFYVAYDYNAEGNKYSEKIVRYTYNPSTGKAASPLILFDNIDAAGNHNGNRLIITPDKKLLFTTGDAGNSGNAQNVNTVNGKIMRINLDGTIPEDNPISGNPVWSWGHRNPQGLAYSPDSSILYSSEHGPANDDEINIIMKGRNYGWPDVEGYCDSDAEISFCNDSNVVEPIMAWTPTLAVAGLVYYNSELIPEWKNSLLLVSLKASKITQLLLDDTGTSIDSSTDFFTNEFGRLRDLCISPDGKVYVATSNRDGRGNPKSDDDKIIEIAPETTAITENIKGNRVSIFPNPVKDFITVTFSNNIGNNAKFLLYSVNGQIIKSGNLEPISTKINLHGDFEGIAFLKLNIDKQSVIKKVLIEK